MDIYVLAPVERLPSESSVADKRVAGLSLRAGWDTLEPFVDEYDWSHFDAGLALAKKAGNKRVMLRVLPGLRTPAWFLDHAGVFNPADGGRIPIPWIVDFLLEWKLFVKALARQYASEPSVTLVHVTGPNWNSAEMHLPKAPSDKAAWQKAGYTSEKLVAAWGKCIAAFGSAFPRQQLSLNVSHPIGADGTVEKCISAARTIGERSVIQHNALAAKTTNSYDIHRLVAQAASTGVTGFQTLCPASNRARFGGPLSKALATAYRAGADFIELYQGDVRLLPKVLTYFTHHS